MRIAEFPRPTTPVTALSKHAILDGSSTHTMCGVAYEGDVRGFVVAWAGARGMRMDLTRVDCLRCKRALRRLHTEVGKAIAA